MREPRHVAILASAGTGKTFALSGRYLSLVLDGVAPERILATTFTRKAAGEILSRVLRRLAEGAASEEGAARLASELGIKGAASFHSRCLDALERMSGAIDRLAVSTIDSFLVRLARGAALDLGLPANWEMVEDDEPLRDEALAAMVEGAPPREMVELLRVLAAGDSRSSVIAWLKEEIGRAYAAYLCGGAELWSAVAPPDESSRLDDAGVAAALGRVRSAPLPLTKGGEPNKTWLKARDDLCAAVCEGDWLRFATRELVGRVMAGGGVFARVEITPGWREALGPLIEHARVVLLGAHARSTAALCSLIERFDGAYKALKRARGVCRFDDVPRALLSAGVAGDLDALYYRLDGRIDHVLLDEFQDTSLEQFRVVEPILAELLAGGERSVLCVGDVKQSLYQWRRAEPELLPALSRRWTQVSEQPLHENWRSSATVLSCVDRVFAGIGANAAIEAESPEAAGASAWAARYQPHAPRRSHRGHASLEESPEAEGRHAQWVATLRRGAERAADVAKAAPWASVGVLVRRQRAIPLLIHLLRREGVDASEEGGSTLDDSPAVSAALSVLRMIDHPGDSAARFHVATSPLGRVVGLEGWSDEVRAGWVAARLRSEVAREGLAAVLGGWLAGVAGQCSPRDLHRFEQLLALAADHEGERTPRLAEFVALVERTPVDDPTPARVRVMTVHQSKGLEFDAVVLPELNGAIPGRAPTVLVERADPLAPPTAVCRYASEALRALDPTGRLEAMNRRRLEREFGEALCVLYVAMTRAKRGLYMVVDPPGGRLCPAALLRAALGAAGGDDAGEGGPRVLWSDGDPGWVEDGPAGPAFRALGTAEDGARLGDASDVPLRLELRRGDRAAPRHLRRASPSSLGGARVIDPARLLTLDEDRAAMRGEMFHAWFQRVGWLEDGEPSDDDLSAAAAAIFPRGYADLRRDIALFRAALRSGDFARVLRRSSYSGRADALRVHCERPFALRTAAPDGKGEVLLEGRLDRMVVGVSGGRAVFAEVVDYKTDAGADGDGPRAIVERHAAQMRAYRMAVLAMCGLAEARVATRLALISSGTVLEVPA